MYTSGYFAKRISTKHASSVSWHALKREDHSYVGFFYPGHTSSGTISEFSAYVASLIESSLTSAPDTSGPFLSSHYGGFLISRDGEPSNVPPPLLLQGEDVKTNNGERFRRAKYTGEIVVSNYEKLRIMCTFTNGGVKTKGRSTDNMVHIEDLMSVLGVAKQSHPLGDYYDAGGQYLISARGDVFIQYEQQSFHDDITAFEDGFVVEPLQAFLQDSSKFYSDDFDFEVTSVLAEANKRTLDILTTMAETPKTVKSVYDGLRFMLRGLVDVKRKNISFLTKSKRVKSLYQRKIFRLEYETRQQFLKARNDKARNAVLASAARNRKQLENDLKNTLNALASAAASVWLNYRYNIMPAVLTIEDAITTIETKTETFFRWSGRVNHLLDMPEISGFKRKGTCSAMERVFIKRAFVPSGMKNQISTNFFSTAWELIPLSFVYDWIINVGDFIATSGANMLDNAYIQGSTISVKPSGAVVYTGQHGSTVTCEIRGYSRTVINPNDYCRLGINPDISGKRQIDALALSFNLFVKKIWKI